MISKEALPGLCISVTGLGQAALQTLVTDYYEREYVQAPGAILTHDGEPVQFLSDRVTHAFQDTPRRHSKRRVQKGPEWDPTRISRAPWIREVIAGNVEGTQCRILDRDCHRFRADCRLYSVRLWDIKAYYYVVWLEPRGSGGLRFSSAYMAEPRDHARYIATAGAIKIL